MKIYFDATETLRHDKVSGIQRVVIRFSQELQRLADESRIEFQLVETSVRGLFEIESNEIPWQETISKGQGSVQADVPRTMALRMARLIRGGFLRFGLASLLDSKVVRVVGRTIYQLESASRNAVLDKHSLVEKEIEKNAVYLCFDSFWGRSSAEFEEIAKLKDRGLVVGFMVHDLIPITHPSLVGRGFRDDFLSALSAVSNLSDVLFFPSETTKRDYLKHVGHKSRQRLVVQTLGADFQTAEDKKNFNKTPLRVVAVGTIDKRKNYGLLVRWFQTLGWQTHELFIIGRSNGTSMELEDSMRKLDQNFVNFHWLQDADDSEVKEVLESSEIGVSASVAEGFGLPTWEMASYGCKLLLADIPINREIAPLGTQFFNPFSEEDFDEKIRNLSTIRALDYRPTSWRQVALATVERLKDFVDNE